MATAIMMTSCTHTISDDVIAPTDHVTTRPASHVIRSDEIIDVDWTRCFCIHVDTQWSQLVRQTGSIAGPVAALAIDKVGPKPRPDQF